MNILEFEQYYQKEIAPQIQQWECYRRAESRKTKEIKLIPIIIINYTISCHPWQAAIGKQTSNFSERPEPRVQYN